MSQHLFSANSEDVHKRLPFAAHSSSAILNVVIKHEFGVIQSLPSRLQHLTAPFMFAGITSGGSGQASGQPCANPMSTIIEKWKQLVSLQ